MSQYNVQLSASHVNALFEIVGQILKSGVTKPTADIVVKKEKSLADTAPSLKREDIRTRMIIKAGTKQPAPGRRRKVPPQAEKSLHEIANNINLA